MPGKLEMPNALCNAERSSSQVLVTSVIITFTPHRTA